MKKIKKLGWQLALCYLAAALLWLAFCGAGLAKTAYYTQKGLCPSRTLAWDELGKSSIEELQYSGDGVWYVSTDPDSQLYWSGPAYLDRVVWRAGYETSGFAVVLYYKTPGKADYSERNSIYATETAPGEYTFQIGGKLVDEIRIDPDSVGGVITRFDGAQLNPARPWYTAFAFTAKGLAAFLLLPLLALAVLHELWALAAMLRALKPR